jgi:mannobiose 2-epimerase
MTSINLMHRFSWLLLVLFVSCMPAQKKEVTRLTLATTIEKSIKTELLNKWYPQVVDTVYGGYLTTFSYDFKPIGPQDKMIVTQARHLWSSSKASVDYPEEKKFPLCALHGFHFLKDVMWDKMYGGFYWLVDRRGNVKDDQKTAYGNAFAIYSLSAYAMAFHDTAALSLAKRSFFWLEEHSHDPVNKGYFQNMKRDGTVIKRTNTMPSTAETGYKDQNSSIHLLEALAELYQAWPNPLVKERLLEMLVLIRDTITSGKGNLRLFFQPDWTPVSFRDSSEMVIMKHHGLDHVSFGHDIETAYLMLEASHVAGLTPDETTLKVAKQMVDHTLLNGWDKQAGGFYDEGYYFKNKTSITIIKDTKNWWAQAEGLNTLLIMADLFPNDERLYYQKFEKLWEYINANLIDHQYGEWYQGGLDKEPEQKQGLKGHIWKASYHQYRALSNCVKRLRSRIHRIINKL